MTLYLVSKPDEPYVGWEAFPSWAQFSWLYLVSALSALRGWLYVQFDVTGGGVWLLGAVALLVCAVILRHWACYSLTRDWITVRNGYTKGDIQSVPLNEVSRVTVQQGVIADFLGIGTLVIRARSSDRVLLLRGVGDPEAVKLRIEAAV